MTSAETTTTKPAAETTTTKPADKKTAPKPPRRTAAQRRAERANKKVDKYKDLSGSGETAETTEAEAATETTTATETTATPETATEEAASPEDDGMAAVLAGMAAAEQSAPTAPEAPAMVAGMVVQRIKVKKIAAHPFNDGERSKPQPNNPKYVELRANVKRWGVKTPGLLVTREGFLKYRPQLEDQIPADAEYVAIYGHRRSTVVEDILDEAVDEAATPEAAEALLDNVALSTMPAVVDDEVMEDDGDMDAMSAENLGREDLSDLAEANQYARYADNLKLSQDAIGERLGVNQATVSRRLNLLLLHPEIQKAVADGKIASAIAAQLGAKAPYGPRRSWQKKKDETQNSDERAAVQLQAFQFVIERQWSPEDAVKRAIAKNESTKKAEAEGFKIVVPYEQFPGGNSYRHRLSTDEEITAAREKGELVGAFNNEYGLDYYTTAKPQETTTSSKEDAEKVEAKARAEAMKARRAAAVHLVKAVPGKDVIFECLALLVTQDSIRASTSSDGWKLAQSLSHQASVGPIAGDKEDYIKAAARVTDTKERNAILWGLVVSGWELSAAATYKSWGRAELAYVDMLKKNKTAGWTPTAWETARIEEAHRKIAADEARTDDEAKRILDGEKPVSPEGTEPEGTEPEGTEPEGTEGTAEDVEPGSAEAPEPSAEQDQAAASA